jgi:acetyl esterase/lipase
MQLFLSEFQKKGIAVVAANYRMYPDAKFPEFIRDCASAVAWV